MNWAKVAKHMNEDAKLIVQRAESAFADDLKTQQEMRTRAALLTSLAEALWHGLDSEERGHSHFLN
jgi:hypothetical protein